MAAVNLPSSAITASSEDGWRSSCCSSLPLEDAVISEEEEDALTTMPESAEEVEAVDEADEEEQ